MNKIWKNLGNNKSLYTVWLIVGIIYCAASVAGSRYLGKFDHRHHNRAFRLRECAPNPLLSAFLYPCLRASGHSFPGRPYLRKPGQNPPEAVDAYWLL